MKKVSKAILILFATLLVLVVGALLGINLYIQSPRTQAQIQDALSKALRLPLKITNTSLTPWSDLWIHGVTVPSGEVNFLETESFHAHYRFFPLLRGRLEIAELTVENPKIRWVQTADGKWKLPALEKINAPEPEKTAPNAAEPGKIAPETPDSKTSEWEPPKSAEKPRRAFVVSVDHLLVKNGSVELLDHDNKTVGLFSDVFLDYSILTPERVEGLASIGRASWAAAPTLENIHTPFIYLAGPEGRFELPALTGTLAGGSVTGHFQAWPEAPKSPFEIGLAFEDIDLNQLATQEGWKQGQTAGQLGGQIELSGEAGRVEHMEGPGKLRLRNGQLQQLELLQAIGQVLGIKELSDFHLQDAHADFHVSGEKVHVDDLVLAAPNLELTAKGSIRFDQRVSLDAQLAVEDEIVKRLPSMVSEGFGTAANGRRTIDFSVGGSTSKLKTNLMDKLIVHKIDTQFGGLLESLFGKKDDTKKKNDEEKEKRKKEKEAQKKAAAATPAPAPTPALPAPQAPPPPSAAPAPAPSIPSTPQPAPAPADSAPPKP